MPSPSMPMLVNAGTENAKSNNMKEPLAEAMPVHFNPMEKKDHHGGASYAECCTPYGSSPATPSKGKVLVIRETDSKPNVVTTSSIYTHLKTPN